MIEDYYNQLAPLYKFMYQDWDASVERQGTILAGIIREFFGPSVRTVLDAACGIGTQCIGLARLGYHMTASDISLAAITVAREEARKRTLQIPFDIVDMRDLSARFPSPFDVIIACDNAIPHLLGDNQIRLAFTQFYNCTAPSGGCIISLRDYGSLDRRGTQIFPRHVHRIEHGRLILFDVWEFAGDFYDLTTYVVEDREGAQPVTHAIRGGRYYCVTLSKVGQLLQETGFRVENVKGRFYQPLLVGLKG